MLQPLVENSLNHGFVDVDKVMEINIRGYISKEKWVIEIEDNGQGFDSEKLHDLTEKMKSIAENDLVVETSSGIGGMRILNLYSRLFLYFGKSNFDFTIRSKAGYGACVIISGYIDWSLSMEVYGIFDDYLFSQHYEHICNCIRYNWKCFCYCWICLCLS